MKHLRKCIGCGTVQDRDKMIKITFDKNNKDITLNPDTKKFGRSVYLCYNKLCIEKASKKNKLLKALKVDKS